MSPESFDAELHQEGIFGSSESPTESLEVEVDTEVIDPHSIALVTTTMYKGWKPGEADVHDTEKIRGDAAIETLRAARERGYNIVVVDSGSSTEFRDTLASMGIPVHDETERGMSASRRQALVTASQIVGVELLFWTEPEKTTYVGSVDTIARQMNREGADIGVPTRDPTLFKETYPDYQYESESEAARRINGYLANKAVTPQKFDWFFGPRVFRNRPEIIELITTVYEANETTSSAKGIRRYIHPDNYSNAIFFPIYGALLDPDIKVIATDPIPFRYPDLQRQNEMTDDLDAKARMEAKRKAQFFGILEEALHYARLHQSDVTSRGKSVLREKTPPAAVEHVEE